MFEETKERALQITEALYRTTELFSDAEPLKWSLRQNALDILNSGEQDLGRVETLMKNLFLKLELASSGTFISKMNFDVLKREYSNLLSKMLSYKDGYQALLDNISRPIEVRQNGIVESKQISDAKKAENEHIGKKVSAKKPSYVSNGEGDSGRQGVIVNALKDKGPSSIGDLVSVFGSSISEKTIQRELNALVNAGTIKKEGEKRWRRYFI